MAMSSDEEASYCGLYPRHLQYSFGVLFSRDDPRLAALIAFASHVAPELLDRQWDDLPPCREIIQDSVHNMHMQREI